MYQTILVPLDGSKRAEAILPHVEKLALQCNAKLIFLQIAPRIQLLAANVPGYDYQKIYDENTREAENYLAGIVGEFSNMGLNVKKFVCHGPIVDTIINIANKENADLIAIASHGRTGLSHVFYGSVASGLLNRIDRPLLLVRSRQA